MFGRGRREPEPLDWNDQHWIEYIQGWRRDYGFDDSREAIAAAYAHPRAQADPVTDLFYTPEEHAHVIAVERTRERGPMVERCLSDEEYATYYVTRDFDATTPTGTWTISFTDRADEFLARLRKHHGSRGTIAVRTAQRSERELDRIQHEVWEAEREIGRRLGWVQTDPGRGVVDVQVVSDDHRYTSLEVARRWGDGVALELVEDESRMWLSHEWKAGAQPDEIVVLWDGAGFEDADLELVETPERIEVALSVPWKTGHGVAGTGADNRRTVKLSAPRGGRPVHDAGSDRARAAATGPMNGDRCTIPVGDRDEMHRVPPALRVEDTWVPHEHDYRTTASFLGSLDPVVEQALIDALPQALAEVATHEGADRLIATLSVLPGPFPRIEITLEGPGETIHRFIQSRQIQQVVDRAVELATAR